MARALGPAVAVRVARLVYRRWEVLAPAERERLEALARNVKERALEVRGKIDGGECERELELATTKLAAELGAEEVAGLRAELRRELERVERVQRERDAA